MKTTAMHYCISGNPQKSNFWPPVLELIELLDEQGSAYCVPEELAQAAENNGTHPVGFFSRRTCDHTETRPDVMVSFGGDGTMLNSAHRVGTDEIPILGVNIGRLGFLASVELSELLEAVGRLESGDYEVESRLVLEAVIDGAPNASPRWALNEFVIDKSGSASMILVKVAVDGHFLNDYWTDGLIISTPTGSTAYSLSSGGPIMVPQSGVIVITPIAPHSLTVRPIVLPDGATIEARVTTRGNPYVFASDGRSEIIENEEAVITIRKAGHRVHLVRLPGDDYFKTLRSKLMWGQRKQM